MSAAQPLGPSPEHFELLRGALDHIARTASKSRSMTRRIRWIEQRALFALRGEVYRDDKIDLPKSGGPDTAERLQKRLAAANHQRDELLALLVEGAGIMDGISKGCYSRNNLETLCGDFAEQARAAIAKATGGAA